jgi:fatty-acyl-CoA synthase
MQRVVIACVEDLRRVEALAPAQYIAHRHVHTALADVARRHAARIALTALARADDDAPRQWRYAELLDEIRRAARLFQSLSGTAAPRVALLMPPLPEAWIALWAAESVGVACPINHALDDAHRAALLAAAGVDIVVTLAPGHGAGDIGTRVRDLQPRLPGVKQVLSVGGAPADGWLDFDAARARHDASPLAVPEVGGLAALFHTGGTTGLPKLAQHTHANQLHAAWGAAQMYGATEHDVVLNGFPLFHVAGAFVYGLSMLLSGAQIVLPPPAGWRDAAFLARAWRVTRERGVTLMAAVPTVMSALLNAPRAAGDAAGVRLLLTGGSPLPSELAARFEAETGVAVRNILGMTECSGVIAIEPARAPRTPGACGLPLPFTQVQALDAQGAALPPGGTGVLRVRGPHVGPGYTDAARNAGTFEDGWLVTGDIGHVDDAGRVFVTGRAKDLIIRGAHNIDPSLIEEALMQHPAVQVAAAVGEPDEYAGELPVAFVVVRPGSAPTPDELLAFTAQRVAERAACPKRITVLGAMPLTPIGKIYKPALRVQATERVLRERVAAAGLQGRVQVRCEDRGGRLVPCFERAADAGDPAPLREAVRMLMAGFALAWEFEGHAS